MLMIYCAVVKFYIVMSYSNAKIFIWQSYKNNRLARKTIIRKCEAPEQIKKERKTYRALAVQTRTPLDPADLL